jgi:hypothetical protein
MILREGLHIKVVTYMYLGSKLEHHNVRCVVYGSFKKREYKTVSDEIRKFNMIGQPITKHEVQMILFKEIVHVDTGGIETELTKDKKSFYELIKKHWFKCVELKSVPDHIYLGHKL